MWVSNLDSITRDHYAAFASGGYYPSSADQRMHDTGPQPGPYLAMEKITGAKCEMLTVLTADTPVQLYSIRYREAKLCRTYYRYAFKSSDFTLSAV